MAEIRMAYFKVESFDDSLESRLRARDAFLPIFLELASSYGSFAVTSDFSDGEGRSGPLEFCVYPEELNCTGFREYFETEKYIAEFSGKSEQPIFNFSPLRVSGSGCDILYVRLYHPSFFTRVEFADRFMRDRKVLDLGFKNNWNPKNNKDKLEVRIFDEEEGLFERRVIHSGNNLKVFKPILLDPFTAFIIGKIFSKNIEEADLSDVNLEVGYDRKVALLGYREGFFQRFKPIAFMRYSIHEAGSSRPVGFLSRLGAVRRVDSRGEIGNYLRNRYELEDIFPYSMYKGNGKLIHIESFRMVPGYNGGNFVSGLMVGPLERLFYEVFKRENAELVEIVDNPRERYFVRRSESLSARDYRMCFGFSLLPLGYQRKYGEISRVAAWHIDGWKGEGLAL